MPYVVIHPRRFEYAAAPMKPVEGVIRDQDTGRPIAGMTLHAAAVDDPRALAPIAGIEAVTDAQGRYRLMGLPKAFAYKLAVEQEEGKPYPRTSYRVRADTPAFEPVPVRHRAQAGRPDQRPGDRQDDRPTGAGLHQRLHLPRQPRDQGVPRLQRLQQPGHHLHQGRRPLRGRRPAGPQRPRLPLRDAPIPWPRRRRGDRGL